MTVQLATWPNSQICIGCKNSQIVGDDSSTVCMENHYPHGGNCQFFAESPEIAESNLNTNDVSESKPEEGS